MNDEISPEMEAMLKSSGATDADLKSQPQNTASTPKPNVMEKCFNPEIYKTAFNDTPFAYFSDPNYYKSCLSGEGESSQILHKQFLAYLNCQSPDEKTQLRMRLPNAYWEFIKSLSPKMNTTPTMSKKLAMRYGILLPKILTPETVEMFAKAKFVNKTNEPVYYLDEWFAQISNGTISISSSDEVSVRSRGNDAERIKQLQARNTGKLQSADYSVANQEAARAKLEEKLQSQVQIVTSHQVNPALNNHLGQYSDSQKRALLDINQTIKELLICDKQLSSSINEYLQAKGIESTLATKSSEAGSVQATVSSSELNTEIGTIRQMFKMTCGRQGNQFPILTKEFFHGSEKTTGFRENVIKCLAEIEDIDPNLFVRTRKGEDNRIVPYVILMPSYGDMGMCWEPFDKYNKATSRGRIAIPMYPKDLKTACITAVADLRWQVAKEKSSFNWMTEGLTGNYYQYVDEHKIKGDIKQLFIQDYIIWINKEANGTQKLPKEVRDIFWRYIPFKQERKDELKNRSLVYLELCKKDYNRSISDGY